MSRTGITEAAVEIAIYTADAYMADTYDLEWGPCAQVLLDSGLTSLQAVAFMQSKHMRWADDSEGRGAGHRKASSAALVRYLDSLATGGKRTGRPFDLVTEARLLIVGSLARVA